MSFYLRLYRFPSFCIQLGRLCMTPPHNPEVVGSNPAPATKFNAGPSGPVFVSSLDPKRVRFHMSDLVDQSRVFANTIDATGNEVIDKGTQGGGSVEVYANEEDAIRRDQYLSSFDGTWISSGSHHVYGTCVIRTSNELTASQQMELEASIVDALIRLE